MEQNSRLSSQTSLQSVLLIRPLNNTSSVLVNLPNLVDDKNCTELNSNRMTLT